MIEIILKGTTLGLVIAVLVGPVFFLLINTSMHKGFIPALYLALGISASDATYIFLTYFGLAQFSNNETFVKVMGLGGGMVLIVFGTYMTFKKIRQSAPMTIEISSTDRLKYFIKGFTLNFINPSVFLFWIGSVGMVSLEYDYYNYKIAAFFGTTVGTVFLTDLLKIYLSKKLSSILSNNVMTWVNRISGLAMVLYGIKLIFEKV